MRDIEYLRIELSALDASEAERAAAEAWEAGAAGIEERDEEGRILLLVYSPVESAEAVRAALGQAVADPGRVGPAAALEQVDWSERWRDGLTAIVISDRLVVRPSFVEYALRPGQSELVIDPGQAFGTGGHESTLLVLEWIDELLGSGALSAEPVRVLDVGTGTGVLALAALRMGAVAAVGFDLDPLAAPEAGHWAEHNEIGDGLSLFTGGIDALGEEHCFDLILANLLKSELMPILGEIAARLRPGGSAVFAGLLATERDEVESALRRVGLEPMALRQHQDEREDDWIGLLAQRN